MTHVRAESNQNAALGFAMSTFDRRALSDNVDPRFINTLHLRARIFGSLI